MDFFNTRMCFGRFWKQQKKFWDSKFFFLIFCKQKFTFRGGEGGRGQGQFGKSLHFEFWFFLHPSLVNIREFKWVLLSFVVVLVNEFSDY